LFRYLSVGVRTHPTYYRDRSHLPVYSRVFEIGWKILDEEVTVKPPSKTALTSAAEIGNGVGGNITKDTKDFQTLSGSPNVKADEGL
jgi:hypothetical protein